MATLGKFMLEDIKKNYFSIFVHTVEKIIKRSASVLISFLLLAVLMSSAVYMIDFKKAGKVLLSMQPSWLFLAFVFMILTFLVNSYRFSVISYWMLGKQPSYYKAVKITWLGGFLALSTPFSALGDVARAGLMKLLMRVSIGDSIQVILFDRGFALFSLLLFALLNSLWCIQLIQQHWLFVAEIIMPAGSLLLLAFVLIAHQFIKWPDNHISNYFKITLDQLSYLFKQPICVTQQIVITFFNLVLYVGTFIALAHALNFSFHVSNLILFSPLILIINNMPFFYLGWGGREAVLLLLAPFLAPNVDSEVILAVSMGYGVLFMIVTLLGGFYLLDLYKANK